MLKNELGDAARNGNENVEDTSGLKIKRIHTKGFQGGSYIESPGLSDKASW